MTYHIYLALFFFNDTATTEIYTLSLHDALPISIPARVSPKSRKRWRGESRAAVMAPARPPIEVATSIGGDRKSTRLNSSHTVISYAVFCLKKKKKHKHDTEVNNKRHCKQRHQCR